MLAAGGSRPDRPAGLRRRWALGPLVALVVVTGVCSATLPAPVRNVATPWTHAAPPGAGRANPFAIDRLAAARTELDRRAAALLRRDRVGWLAGVDPNARVFRGRQAAVFANIAAVPLAVWGYRIDPGDQAGRTDATGAWTVRASLAYSLRGVDPAPTSRPVVLTFVQRGTRWLLAADDRTAADGTRTWRGPWEYGPLAVRSGRTSIVLAHPANADRMAVFSDAVDAAVPRVSAVVGPRWPKRVAVIIPSDRREMVSLVGERLALGKIAAVAVADAVDPGSGQARGQRVVINPANLDKLGPLARRVVLQHEVTHVATRGWTGPGTPIWLVEGFADYVGYLGTGLSPRMVGDELQRQVHAGTWPGRLPRSDDFAGDSPRLSVAYEEAWSACRLIAERRGTPALLRFYREVGTADDPEAAVDPALRRVLGLSAAQFLAEWQSSVRSEFR
ncbi:MAG TPA: hypothetical protein VF109_08005 [Mycobacteriales bacterium]